MATGHIDRMGSGVLFSNDKRTHEKAPHYKGHILLSRDYKAGEKVKISAWTKNTGKGVLISLSEDNWSPSGTYPKEVNRIEDNEVPF
jgi:hypothetical protein